jgi:dTDP-glucose 4,6-dehydratase
MSDEVLPVNIGNPVEISIRQLAEEILELTGHRSTITYQPLPSGFEDDPKVRQPDTTRARTILGWAPKVDRMEGLQATLDNFKARLQV